MVSGFSKRYLSLLPRVPIALASVFVLIWVLPLLWLLRDSDSATPAAEHFRFQAASISLALSSVVALGASCMGILSAILISRARPSMRFAFLILLSIPLLLPSYLLAIAWAPVLSPTGLVVTPLAGAPAFQARGFLAAAWVQTCSFFPVATIILHASLRRWPSSLEDAANANGVSGGTLLRLKLQWLKWPLAFAFVMVMLLSAGEFAVPDYFGVRTLGAEIFAIAAAYLDPQSALVTSLPLFAGCAALIVALLLIAARWQQTGMQGGAPVEGLERHRKSEWVLVMMVLIILVVPAIALIQSLANGPTGIPSLIRNAASLVTQDVHGSVLIASLVALITMPWALASAHWSSREPRFAAQLPRVAGALALSSPVGLWAIGASAMSSALPMIAGAAWTLLVTGLAIRSVAPATEVLAAGSRSIGPEQEEAARAMGLARLERWTRILFPQYAPFLAMAAAVSWIWTLNDVTLTVMLGPPGHSTLMLRIFQTVHYGPPEFLAALVVLQIGLIATGVLVAWLLVRAARRLAR